MGTLRVADLASGGGNCHALGCFSPPKSFVSHDSERSQSAGVRALPWVFGYFAHLSIPGVVSIFERAPETEPVRVERVSVVIGPFEKMLCKKPNQTPNIVTKKPNRYIVSSKFCSLTLAMTSWIT